MRIYLCIVRVQKQCLCIDVYKFYYLLNPILFGCRFLCPQFITTIGGVMLWFGVKGSCMYWIPLATNANNMDARPFIDLAMVMSYLFGQIQWSTIMCR